MCASTSTPAGLATITRLAWPWPQLWQNAVIGTAMIFCISPSQTPSTQNAIGASAFIYRFSFSPAVQPSFRGFCRLLSGLLLQTKLIARLRGLAAKKE